MSNFSDVGVLDASALPLHQRNINSRAAVPRPPQFASISSQMTQIHIIDIFMIEIASKKTKLGNMNWRAR